MLFAGFSNNIVKADTLFQYDGDSIFHGTFYRSVPYISDPGSYTWNNNILRGVYKADYTGGVTGFALNTRFHSTNTYYTRSTSYSGWYDSYVEDIQYGLYKVGYLSWSSIDGYFGPTTKQAVINFQSRNGLSADGVVGYNTWYYLSTTGQGVLSR
ncbi:peptidoglycan-binding protein [Clostridium sp. YIM B02515]|uniref:Peptidoglycan-binding protein n=2 Tax=Clostridium rhizosphaerae TaxID=2803861 RepID=A0ABS1THA8_9CLOT|nr:peptidoglycan-binding protein [Clostridium rhizosphaerae]